MIRFYKYYTGAYKGQHLILIKSDSGPAADWYRIEHSGKINFHVDPEPPDKLNDRSGPYHSEGLLLTHLDDIMDREFGAKRILETLTFQSKLTRWLCKLKE